MFFVHAHNTALSFPFHSHSQTKHKPYFLSLSHRARRHRSCPPRRHRTSPPPTGSLTPAFAQGVCISRSRRACASRALVRVSRSCTGAPSPALLHQRSRTAACTPHIATAACTHLRRV